MVFSLTVPGTNSTHHILIPHLQEFLQFYWRLASEFHISLVPVSWHWFLPLTKKFTILAKLPLLNLLLFINLLFFSNNVNKRVFTYKCLLCFWSNSWLKITDFVNWRIWNKKVKTIVILCDQHLWWSDGDL